MADVRHRELFARMVCSLVADEFNERSGKGAPSSCPGRFLTLADDPRTWLVVTRVFNRLILSENCQPSVVQSGVRY